MTTFYEFDDNVDFFLYKNPSEINFFFYIHFYFIFQIKVLKSNLFLGINERGPKGSKKNTMWSR